MPHLRRIRFKTLRVWSWWHVDKVVGYSRWAKEAKLGQEWEAFVKSRSKMEVNVECTEDGVVSGEVQTETEK